MSIADTIKTYEGEIKATPEHVDKWASQFTKATQLDFLREVDHVMKECFVTKDDVMKFLTMLVTNKDLTGGDPKSYWAKANFLKIQKNGKSQKEMLALFDSALQSALGLKLKDCGGGRDYIYLDDILFTGGRVATDLRDWIANAAPGQAHVNVILMAFHTSGQYWQGQKQLPQAARDAKKQITFRWWRCAEIENQKNRKDVSGVLWPAVVPNVKAVQEYVAAEKKNPLVLRVPGGPVGVFTSEQGRQLLESELLIAGVKILSQVNNPKAFIRPLGCGPFGVGFGATYVTYRNCPNNCPLALWWGKLEGTSGALDWYPLLPRKTYGHFDWDDIDF
ncbi:phosphoribosyltransferase-like protein [Ramlibacter sp.]|uniref:phosphoribosyltransferase-like protein n=1 Tax=Ramlibacter sp. TaxID=1917967 RepID=UPI002D774C70|nr:hypothetical protein [Ramlibacter sp.]